VRQQRRQVGAVAAPTDLTEADAAATAEIEENRGEMLRALLARGGTGAGVLETVLNHKSFAQTVENIFALSFMARARALPALPALPACPAARTAAPGSGPRGGPAPPGAPRALRLPEGGRPAAFVRSLAEPSRLLLSMMKELVQQWACLPERCCTAERAGS